MSYDLIKNFKQGRIADTRENVEIIQQKVEEHDSQISQQIVFSKIESMIICIIPLLKLMMEVHL